MKKILGLFLILGALFPINTYAKHKSPFGNSVHFDSDEAAAMVHGGVVKKGGYAYTTPYKLNHRQRPGTIRYIKGGLQKHKLEGFSFDKDWGNNRAYYYYVFHDGYKPADDGYSLPSCFDNVIYVTAKRDKTSQAKKVLQHRVHKKQAVARRAATKRAVITKKKIAAKRRAITKKSAAHSKRTRR